MFSAVKALKSSKIAAPPLLYQHAVHCLTWCWISSGFVRMGRHHLLRCLLQCGLMDCLNNMLLRWLTWHSVYALEDDLDISLNSHTSV